MFTKTLASSVACLMLCATNSFAHNISTPDAHAPIGVMGEHTHKKGEWMTSYRYSRMEMDGNRRGTNRVSPAEVLEDFNVTPTEMTMEMHMFGVMYAPHDKLTLMAMAPYVRKSMNHVNRAGTRFKTSSEGLGDIKLSGLITIFGQKTDKRKQHVHLNIGVSLPSGSVNERDTTPMGNDQKLPYPMQLGSGTYDPILGVTYLDFHDGWSWGSQANTVLRFGKNSQGYRLGNEYNATSWIAKNLNKFVSTALRIEGKIWDNIDGQDNELNPAIVPTARTDLRGGTRVDALFSVNLLKPEGVLKNSRIAGEFGVPIYQKLDGPQLETDYRFTLGWQMSF